MFSRETRDEKKSVQAFDLLRWILVMSIAALFVVFFASSVGARAFNIKGGVVAIDSAAKILTLNPSGTSDQLTFHAGWGPVEMGDKMETFNNIKVGDEVTIRYYQNSDGNYVAEGITLLPLPPAMHKG